MRVLHVIAYVVALFTLAAPARGEEPLAEGLAEAQDVVFPPRAADPAPSSWSTTFNKPMASFLRVHFTDIVDAASSDYEVTVRDGNNRPVRSYTKADFSGPGLWSPLVRGDTLRVEVSATTPPAGLTFRIDTLVYQEKHAAKYSLVHNPPLLEEIIKYKDEPRIFTPSRAVAKLVFSANGKSYSCSGFLVAEDRFLTNQHCIDRKETCERNAVAIFGYELTDTGLNPGEQFECLELIDVDAALDVALIRLAKAPGRKYGWLPLTRRDISEGEQTYLIQHPNGETKQIARKQCFVSTLRAEGSTADTDIGHQCDTVGGASGSPLLGKDFKVVGVHHLGFSLVGRWKAENRAIQIGKVMDRLNLQ